MSRKSLPLVAVLALLIGCAASTASAQNYAVPGGTAYTTDGDCGDPSNPCSLSGAVEDATDGGASGNTVFAQLPFAGGVATFFEDLKGTSIIDDLVTFDTYLDDGGPTTGIDGIVEIDGDVTIDEDEVLTLVGNLALHLVRVPMLLEMRDNAEIDGDGVLVFKGGVGE